MIRTYVMLLAVFVVGCSANRAPTELHTALRNATSLELHSLDPTQTDADHDATFHNWTDLGSADVSAAAIRARLLDSLDAGISDNDGMAAACFDPRHGLRAKCNGKIYDVVICFHCYQAQWYIDDVEQTGFLLTGIPQPTFDKILTAASVKLAPPAPE